MIELKNMSLMMGSKLLFENVNCAFYPSQKIGLSGKNGTGKSTLFKAILEGTELDSGSINIANGLTIAHVKQEIADPTNIALDYVKQGDEKLHLISSKIDSANDNGDYMKASEYMEEYEALGGYTLETRAYQLLHGLSFTDEQILGQIKNLSGGWQIRLNLAQALLSPSDVLLLDEPTNHLDLDAVLWLEKWLNQYQGMILLISHDRIFMDNTINQIAHLQSKTIKMYGGNYSQFEKQRASNEELQEKQRDKQQKQVAHLQSFVDRFKAKASKAKQAQSRMKMIEKIQIIDAVDKGSILSFKFDKVAKLNGILLQLSNADIGYESKNILNGINLSINSSDRIGLLGENGAGKSTLIKALVGDIGIQDGECIRNDKLTIGYFAQNSMDKLMLDETPLMHAQSVAPKKTEAQLRAFLGSFAFSNDMAVTNILSFSGGEKARLALALIMLKNPNIILLDEPTNHLDIDMRASLTLAMQYYEGAIILVSHDRFFLEATVDSFLLVRKGKVAYYDGDMSDYQKLILEDKKETRAEIKKSKSSKSSKISDSKTKNTNKKQLQSYKKKADKLESQLKKNQDEIAQITNILDGTEIYKPSQKDELLKLLSQKKILDVESSETEESWLLAVEKYENLKK